jgi:Ca2+-binding EF-hand superfamily protein
MFERSFNPDEGMVRPLASGQSTVRELARAAANTPEYRQRYLSGNREAGVTALYKHLLGRDPDAAGLQVQVRRANAEGYEPVIEAILSSSEYNSKYGDYGVAGSNLRYCGTGQNARSGGARGRFAQMDRNNDGAIQRSEWTGTARSFTSHDWNGDDVLSGDELRVGTWRSRQSGEEDYDPNGAFSGWDESSFNQIDRNNDGRVSSREWYYDTQSFVRADRNRDGFLSRSEFLGADVDDDRGDQFDSLDANNNGYIDRREWHGASQAFQWLDRDNDNLLSRAEMTGSSRQWDQFAALDSDQNGRLTPEEWRWSRRSFNQQDVNGDGVLSRREFTSGGGVPTSGR